MVPISFDRRSDGGCTKPASVVRRTTTPYMFARRVLTIVLAGVILTGCFTGNANGPTVAVWGDSITALSTDAIANYLEPSYGVNIEGVPGATIGDEVGPIAQAIAVEQPSEWIIELGTNDALRGTAWQRSLDTLIHEVSYASCVVLTTVGLNTPIALQINETLRFVTLVKPNFILLDWHQLLATHLAWLQSDGIHPNRDGQSALAAWDGFALHLCP